MLSLFDLCRTTSEVFHAAPAQIILKDSIRIVEIADDQIETRKIRSQLWRQFGILRKKTGERSVFDRTNGLRVEPIFRKHCNVLVTEDLDVRVRIRLTQGLQCWQSENEIPDRAAADNQNAVHALL